MSFGDMFGDRKEKARVFWLHLPPRAKKYEKITVKKAKKLVGDFQFKNMRKAALRFGDSTSSGPATGQVWALREDHYKAQVESPLRRHMFEGLSGMREGSAGEYRDAVGNIRHATKEQYGGKRYWTVVWKDNHLTEVAEKNEIMKRGKVVETSYRVNPDYL